jgi:hypothetical protein
MPIKSTKPATCHPEKPARNRAGECDACYRKRMRKDERTIASTVNTINELELRGKSVLELAEQARQELYEALPQAARWIKRAAEKAAERGDSRPAETILREVEVPTADGKTERLLSPPARQYQHDSGASSGPQIIIGVQVGQLAPGPATSSGSVAGPATINVQAEALPMPALGPSTSTPNP